MTDGKDLIEKFRLETDCYYPFMEYMTRCAKLAGNLSEGLFILRKNTGLACADGMLQYGDMVFCAIEKVIAFTKRILRDGGEKDSVAEVEKTSDFMRRVALLGVWGLNKVCYEVDAADIEMVCDRKSHWWTDYKTDWLIENFKSWGIYLKTSKVSPSASGAYVSFVLDGDGSCIALSITEIGKSSDFEVVSAMTIPLPRGFTIGSVADSVREVCGEFDGNRIDMIFALLVACLGDMCEKSVLLINLENGRTAKGTVDDIPQRSGDDEVTRGEIEAMMSEPVCRVVVCTVPKRDGVN